jgi:lipoprotein NlpI
VSYERAIRVFYRGLASLQVGLLDDAKRDFAQASELAPNEPASWANLAVSHLRSSEFDGATRAADRAVSLAPDDARVALLQGQLDCGGRPSRPGRASSSAVPYRWTLAA